MYNNLYEIRRDTNLIDDDTIIIISIEDQMTGRMRRLARGHWYNDDVLEYINKEFIDMKITPQENKVFVEISPLYEDEFDDESARYEENENLFEEWLTNGRQGGALGMLQNYRESVNA